MKRVLICTLLLVCLLSVTTLDTFADGKYFPAKAYRTSPTIHSQRAILKYKDGVESLLIESSFDGGKRVVFMRIFCFLVRGIS